MKSLPNTLKAHYIPINLAVNVDRAYEILFQRGLFNSWVVIIAYGRYGQKGGQTKTYVSSKPLLRKPENELTLGDVNFILGVAIASLRTAQNSLSLL